MHNEIIIEWYIYLYMHINTNIQRLIKVRIFLIKKMKNKYEKIKMQKKF